MRNVKLQMENEKEINLKTQEDLETDLTSTKHQLLEIKRQLQLAEVVIN